MVLLLRLRLIADNGFVRLRPNSASANLSGLHTTCTDTGGLQSSVGLAVTCDPAIPVGMALREDRDMNHVVFVTKKYPAIKRCLFNKHNT